MLSMGLVRVRFLLLLALPFSQLLLPGQLPASDQNCFYVRAPQKDGGEQRSVAVSL